MAHAEISSLCDCIFRTRPVISNVTVHWGLLGFVRRSTEDARIVSQLSPSGPDICRIPSSFNLHYKEVETCRRIAQVDDSLHGLSHMR